MKKILALLVLLSPLMAHAASVTYSTPGSNTFTVPPFTGTMTMTVNGAGGGGGGGTLIMRYGALIYEFRGGNGTGSTVTYVSTPLGLFYSNGGGGGEGGQAGAGNPAPIPGTGGTATGGNTSNTTGAGNSGGAGGNYATGANGGILSTGSHWFFSGASGGAGGQAVSNFASGAIAMGTPITVFIGTAGYGGAGGFDSVDPYNTDSQAPGGGGGAPGSVVITWGDRANTAPSPVTITGPTTGTTNISNNFSFQTTDPEGDSLHYGVDWDNNGSIDNWYDTYPNTLSGTSKAASRTWSSPGTYPIRVIAQDAGYLSSATSTLTIVISNPSVQVLSCTGSQELYTTSGSYPRAVPPSYSNMVVELWGGGGGGAGGGGAGASATASTFWGVLSANGGLGGGPGTPGGTGGTASGGDTNTSAANGGTASGSNGGAGSGSPNGGGTALGGFSPFWIGSAGAFPGGGGGGGGNTGKGGGGGGGYVKKTYTPATLPPNTLVTLVVGSGGVNGALPNRGGPGSTGRITVVCTPVVPVVSISSDAPLVGGVRTLNAGATAHVTANYTPPNGDTLTATAINGNDQVTSVPCADISPFSSSCWLVPDVSKVYTFSTTTLGTYTFYAGAQTTNIPTYANYASTQITVIAPPSLTIWANAQQNQLTISSGQSANITWSSSNVESGSCRVTNTGDATIWSADNDGVGHTTGALTTSRNYILNCNTVSGSPANPVTVAIIIQPTLPVFDNSTLSVQPSRIRVGATATTTWNVTGLSAGTSCSISPALGSGIASWNGVGSSWTGSQLTAPINDITTFTLTCINGTENVSTSKTIFLLPKTIEL